MLLYEKNNFGKDYQFQTFLSDNLNFISHFHRNFEFLYVIEGEEFIEINFNKFILKKGQGIFILPNEIHSYKNGVNSKSLLCIFSPLYINHFYKEIENKRLNNPIIDNFDKIYNFEKLLNENSNIYNRKGMLYELCALIGRSDNLVSKSNKSQHIYNVVDFVQEHFTEEISLEIVAKKFNYDYKYLSKQINNMLCMNFSEFINLHRISYACALLKTTDNKITDIAYLSGYTSIRSFNRNFHSIMGINPREYLSS